MLSTRPIKQLFLISCGYISTIVLFKYVNEKFAPNNSQKMMLWLVRYWVDFEASQLDTGMV
jgi:hypothetical protein